MRGRSLALGCALLLGAPAALAHPERHAFFPDGSVGAVPKYRTHGGQLLVVCKSDWAARIRRAFAGRGPKNTRLRRARLRLVKRCR
jgi:hypothetical protein